jgi:DnaJ-domain-containing protein 1
VNQFTLTDLIVVLFLGLVAGYFVVSFIVPERVRKNLRRRSQHVRFEDHVHERGSTRERPRPNRVVPPETGKPVDLPGTDRECAAILGLSGRVTLHQIKVAYRNEMAKYHPDKVNHLAPEFHDLARARTRRIRAAYEHFRRKYDF